MSTKEENNISESSITKIVLDNNVRLIHCKIPTSSFVTIEISVLAGSRNESDDEMGIAHFLEHTMFSGTDKRPNNKVIGFEIESLGGSMNAFTSEETTAYYIKIPYENFTKAFEILSDMFLHSNFNSSYLEIEKGVVKEELRMYEDTPQRDIFTLYNELLYKGTPLGRDIGGTVSSIDNITRAKVINFIKNNYYLNNIVISIVGNVDTKEAIDTVIKYFKNDNLGASSLGTRALVNGENKYIKSKFSEDNIKVKKKAVNQTHFILGLRGYPAGDNRQYSLNVLSAIIGGGFGAWLFQKLRNEMGV
ncbi:MAG: M16 family metallopeptidase, partial [Patescibacteria group bacterium]